MATLKDVTLGCDITDTVTGLKGSAIAIMEMLSGTVQIMIQPKGKGLTIPDAHCIDIQSLKVTGKGTLKDLPKTADVGDLKLGQTMKDKASGYEGVATQKVSYLNGCVAFGILPKGKKNKIADTIYIDWNRLEVIDDKLVPKPVVKKTEEAKPKTGGPSTRMSAMKRA